ncbi:MAG TPA: TolC family protein [Kofleriaceae bacterium]|nr:TolC family protein [Kofleriaceae bacterium]
MRLVLSVVSGTALALLAGSAFAQPAKRPAPAPPAQGPDAVAAFDKELDALFAQGGLTSDQAAKRAAGASPTVRRAVADIDVSIATAEAAELVRVPRVGANATYTRLSPIDPVFFGDPANPMTPKLEFNENSYVVEGSLNIALSDYLTRYPKIIAGARLGIAAAEAGKRTSEINAGQDARVAYYEWVRAKLQVLVARRQLAQVRATLGQVRALAEAQRISNADRMRVESQEAQAEQVADQLQNLADLREEQLRLLIGAGNEPLAIGEDIRGELAAPPSSKLDDLMATAHRQRLEFKTFDFGIRAKEKQRDAEKASYFPRLSAFAVADYARPNNRVFPQVDEFRFTWQAGLQLSWTLNDALVSRTNVKRFSAEIRGLQADRENLEQGTRIQVLAAQQAVELAQKSFATSAKGLAAAEESYRVRQALLEAQRATAVELVDAETELTRARIAALNARIDLRVAMAQLAHALGNDVK